MHTEAQSAAIRWWWPRSWPGWALGFLRTNP